MRSTSPIQAILVLILVAGAVHAQEVPQPGSVKERGQGEGPRLVVPGGSGPGGQEKPIPSGEGVDPVTRAELGKLLVPLSYLPDSGTRTRSIMDRFLATPEAGLLPMLSTVFRQGRSDRMRGAVRVLGALKSPAGAKLLRESLLLYPFKKVTKEALDTAWMLDREATRPYLFSCLESKHGELRKRAEGLLRRRIRIADKDRLIALAGAKRSDTRLRALRMLTVLMPPGVEAAFVHALSDPHRACRRRAGKGLALAGTFPATAKALVAAGPEGTGGGEAFKGALLAAINQETRRRGKVLVPAWTSLLIDALDHRDRLVVALAAGALAHLAYASTDLTGKPFQERRVMETLVTIVADQDYYPGQGDALAVARLALQTLSGTGHRYSGGEWRRWWKGEGVAFAGNRARLPLDSEVNRGRTVVVLRDRVEVHVVRPKGVPWGRLARSREILVEAAEQARLVGDLLTLGIMDHPVPADLELRDGVEVSLWLAGRRLRVLAPPRTDWLEALVKAVLDTVGRHQWQLYAPEGKERARWLADNEAFFRRAKGVELGRRLKELVVARLPKLDGAKLMRALGHLLEIEGVEKILTPQDIDALLSCVRDEKYVNAKVEGVLFVISQVPGAESWKRVLDYLDGAWRRGGKLMLTKYLGRAGRERVDAAFGHASSRVRSGVIRHVASRGRRGWVPRLEKCLGDKSADIRSAALWALARMESYGAIGKVLELARRDPSPKVRRGALNFCGRSRLQRVLAVLVAGLNDNDPSIRMAAVQALGASRLPKAASFLTDMLAVDPGGPGGMLVRRTLAAWGGPIVRRTLHPLLASPQAKLREATTWLLADLLDPVVMPTLIKWLRDPEKVRRIPHIRKVLCAITCTPCAKDWVDFYDRWHREHQGESDAKWFLDALAESRYRISFKEQDLLPGAGLKAVPQLVQLMRDAEEWYFRVQASHRLREITGESFGVVEMETGRSAIEAIASAWLGWLKVQRDKSR